MIVLSNRAVFSADCKKDREKIRRQIRQHRCPKDVYYILLRGGQENGLFDIISGRELKALPSGETDVVAAGIARTKSEALELVAEMINDRRPQEPGLKERLCFFYKS